MFRAITRSVSSSFADALVATPLPSPLDLALARSQHAAYVEALASLGAEVLELPPLEGYPDACFVEDVAVVHLGRALLTRPGHPSRRGEVDSVAHVLGGMLPCERMSEGCLDGGDVLCVGRRIYVGRSKRTDALGIEALRRRWPECEVIPVEIYDGLHLKSFATALPDDRILIAEGKLDASALAEPLIAVDPAEPHASNVVCAPAGAVLMPSGCPETERALRATGYRVRTVDNSELRKADSALTCLSILILQ